MTDLASALLHCATLRGKLLDDELPSSKSYSQKSLKTEMKSKKNLLETPTVASQEQLSLPNNSKNDGNVSNVEGKEGPIQLEDRTIQVVLIICKSICTSIFNNISFQ